MAKSLDLKGPQEHPPPPPPPVSFLAWLFAVVLSIVSPCAYGQSERDMTRLCLLI